MTNGVNKVVLMGYLGADAELQEHSSGPNLKFRIATNRRWTDKEGKPEERVDWHAISYWGRSARGLTGMLKKGALVMVEGRLKTSSYTRDGIKRYWTEIVANRIELAREPKDAPRSEQSSDVPRAEAAAAQARADVASLPAA